MQNKRRLDFTARKTLEKVAALALHPATQEAEWQAAAIGFFRVARASNTSAQELLQADTTYHAPRYSCFGFGRYKGVKFTDVPTSYLQWALKNVKHLTPACRQAIREILAAEEFDFTAG